MQKHVTKVAAKIRASSGQTFKVFITVGVYTALFLTFFHTGLVRQGVEKNDSNPGGDS